MQKHSHHRQASKKNFLEKVKNQGLIPDSKIHLGEFLPDLIIENLDESQLGQLKTLVGKDVDFFEDFKHDPCILNQVKNMKKSDQNLQKAFDNLAGAMYDSSRQEINQARQKLTLALEETIFDIPHMLEALHDAILTGIEYGRGDEGLSTGSEWRNGESE